MSEESGPKRKSLGHRELVAHLKSLGYEVEESSVYTDITNRVGPPYFKRGRANRYYIEDGEKWAKERFSDNPVFKNSAEFKAWKKKQKEKKDQSQEPDDDKSDVARPDGEDE